MGELRLHITYIVILPSTPMSRWEFYLLYLPIPRIVHQIKNPHELLYRVHSEGTEIDQISANWMCTFPMHKNTVYDKNRILSKFYI